MGFRTLLRRKAYKKLVLYFVCFVALAVLIASLFKNGGRATASLTVTPARAPSSIIAYDEDGNPVVDMSLEEVNNDTGARTDGPLFRAVKSLSDDWGSGKIDAQEHTGIDAKRARRVIFQPGVLHLAKSKGSSLRLNLFDDMVLKGSFLPSSEFHLNKGMYIGKIAGDPDGLFRINVVGSAVSGTIETQGHEFQIIDAGDGQQYIIELASSKAHH